MKSILKLMSILMLFLSMVTQAGVIKPTAHSRANCGGFNESVTWHLGHSYWWRVESHHFLSVSERVPHHIN